MPLISVIIPVFNSQKTINETIGSVLKQTLSNLEVIVINDGSTDEGLEKIATIKDPRVQVFSYPNAGVAVSRNRGIERARGEYISFLDADDLWTPDKLEAQLKALQENPPAAVAYSWTDYIDEAGNFLYHGSHITVNGDVTAKLLFKNFIENGSNPLIRRHALVEVGEFDSSLPPAEDWDMWLRLAARYHFVAVPHPQILYRMSAGANSANISKMETQGLKVIHHALSLTPDSLQSLKKPSIANFYQYLTFRVLTGNPSRTQCLSAARCFGYAIINDPGMLQRQNRLMSIVFLKIIAGILLPPQQARKLLKMLKERFSKLE
ncbi:glycosyltransferase [Phormidium pseudopriestleyi FRX01]|uniref:Glycosyltransferase n=1 Tax=Phormidium pseudopriestleyi FRX01 TaxID=1759528 RepID=A0ABS3FRK5_9CYAN|nr:glycosyltransferase [Phormidium pseudopriestleyi]MBO0349487.1 glycosyltransferase [Phormidium pseudopriestleyi FRX01]